MGNEQGSRQNMFDSDLCQSQHAVKIMFPASQFAQCQARETPA